MPGWVDLHVHSNYSFLDGASDVDDLADAAVESVRSNPATDEDDVALFVGSAHPLAAKPPLGRGRR